MASSSMHPVALSSTETDKLNKTITELKELVWETGEYYFYNFIDYFQLPQIIRVGQPWNTEFVTNQLMYLQALFDRYLITATSLTNRNKSSNETYLIPDWFQGECRVLSKNPKLKKRWWIFQGAFELYRFQLPRTIKVLSHTPAHIKSGVHEWSKVVLCKNAHLRVVRREKYQSRVKTKQDLFISEPKEAFILQDLKTNDEFIVPPGVPLRFATPIEDWELHEQYQNHHGTFTLPEILMRYEFPIDIEILTHLPIDLLNFTSQVRFEKFCVAKSVLAYLIDDEQIKFAEISPMTNFTIRCAKCLTFGLSKEGGDAKDEKFDENEYQHYENFRSKIKQIFEERNDVHRSKILLASQEEIESIDRAYEISMSLREKDEKPADNSYLTLKEAFVVIREQNKDKIPFSKLQPNRFTVHASADPSNPYNEIIDYENMDSLNANTRQSRAEQDDHKINILHKRSSSLGPPEQRSQLNERPALVVQQLPPPMLLPPETFEKTVKAIPEKLYTELLPATRAKTAGNNKNP